MKNGEGCLTGCEGSGMGESGSHDDTKGDDAGKVGGDQLLYFLLTTSCLEINDWLIRLSCMCSAAAAIREAEETNGNK